MPKSEHWWNRTGVVATVVGTVVSIIGVIIAVNVEPADSDPGPMRWRVDDHEAKYSLQLPWFAQHKECGLWGADFDTKEDGKWKQRIHIESDMAPLSGMDLSWRLCLDPHDYTAKVKISANRGGGEFPNHHDKAGMGDQSETNTAAACANIADANGRATRELTLKNLDKLGTTHIDPRFFCIRTEKHLVRVSTADYKTISVDTNALDAQIILTVTTWTRGKSV